MRTYKRKRPRQWSDKDKRMALAADVADRIAGGSA